MDANNNLIGVPIAMKENQELHYVMLDEGFQAQLNFTNGYYSLVAAGACVYESNDCSGTCYLGVTGGAVARQYPPGPQQPLFWIPKSLTPVSVTRQSQSGSDGASCIAASGTFDQYEGEIFSPSWTPPFRVEPYPAGG